MDAVVQTQQWFLPALADAVSEWFPELNGRAFAASDVNPMKTKEGVPTLPIAMLALLQSEAAPPTKSAAEMFMILDTFCIDFWLQPMRQKMLGGIETPFWAYYPYEDIRDTLLTNMARWEGPDKKLVQFRRLSITADPFAVILSFHFTTTFRWCFDSAERGLPFTVGFGLRAPESCIPEDEPCPSCDPCP